MGLDSCTSSWSISSIAETHKYDPSSRIPCTTWKIKPPAEHIDCKIILEKNVLHDPWWFLAEPKKQFREILNIDIMRNLTYIRPQGAQNPHTPIRSYSYSSFIRFLRCNFDVECEWPLGDHLVTGQLQKLTSVKRDGFNICASRRSRSTKAQETG